MLIHVFVNKNRCPYKCFVELYFLTVYQDLFLIALLVVTVSVVREHRMPGVRKMQRVSNEFA